MAINRDGDGPPLRREDAPRTTKPPADGLRASPFTEDVFDDEYYGRRPRSSGLSFSTIVGVVFFAAVVAAAGWYILAERSAPATVAGGEGEVVRADPAPYKVKPENPGGLQVANQDKLIYDDRLGKGPAPKHAENLLPAPEEPRAPPVKAPEPKVEAKAEAKAEEPKPADQAAPAPEAKAEPKSESAAKSASADPLAELMVKVEGMRKPEAETAPAPAPAVELKGRPTAEAKFPTPPSAGISGAVTPASSIAPAPTLAPPAPAATGTSPMLLVPASGNAPPSAAVAEKPTVVASAAPSVATAPPASSPAAEPVVAGQIPLAGAVYVQLASAPSSEAAMGEWKRISSKYSDLLGNLAPSVAQAEIPDKGTMYRLRAGPISDRTAAQDLCGNLIARGLRCLIVKP
jgi:hypothetical protein